MQIEIHRGLEHSLKNSQRLSSESVASETVSNQRIVMGPHTPVVICHRVIPGFAFGNSSNTPTGKRPRRHQRLTDKTSMISGCNARYQALTCVRGAHTTRPLVAIERQGKARYFFAPESAVKVFAE